MRYNLGNEFSAHAYKFITVKLNTTYISCIIYYTLV